MLISIDKTTNIVAGINLPASPLFINIEVPDNFMLGKIASYEEGQKQKNTDNGNPLFYKDVYRTDIINRIVGQDETLEDTGKPVMVTVQKEDIYGNLLYLEPLIDDDSNIDYVEVTKSVDEDGSPLQPATEIVQKYTQNGKPVFYKDIIELIEIEVFDHMDEVTEDTGKPVMVPNIVTKYVTMFEKPEVFNIAEILTAKYRSILNASRKTHMFADIFLDESNIDFNNPNHSANIGVGFLQLFPNGEAKTKNITLEIPSFSFEILEINAGNGIDIYLGDQKFNDNKLELLEPIDSCTIRFVNTTDKPRLINSYAIGY
jgi:hypothetical protein